MPNKDIKSQETEWEWGSRQDLLQFAETLGEGELIQVDHAHPAMFTGDGIDPGDDLCRFRREPRSDGALPYPRWIMQMFRKHCDIENLPTAEGESG